jgi:hypothetical protein
MLLLKKTPAPVMMPLRRCSHRESPFVCGCVRLRRTKVPECTYEIVHVCGAQHEHTNVVRPLNVIQLAAVQSIIGSIEELIGRAHQANCTDPVVHFVGPIRVGCVTGVDCQPSSHVEKAAVGDGIFVVVAIVESKDLPFQPTITRRGIPSNGLRIEDCLCKGEPLWLVCRWIWISVLRSRECSHAPKCLIVVTFCLGLIRRHVIVVRSNLGKKSLSRDLVVCIIASEVPIVHQCAKHCPSLPPVIRIWQISWNVPRLIPSVILHHALSSGLCSSLDGICKQVSICLSNTSVLNLLGLVRSNCIADTICVPSTDRSPMEHSVRLEDRRMVVLRGRW